jgi:hypothetical protein
MTQRQLLNLLAAGEGTFWERYKVGRETVVKLKGVGRVAVLLGVVTVRYRAAYIPIEHLRAGHGIAEAAIYAAFHAARGCEEQHNAPISRLTLSTLTGRSVRTLLNYDQALNIQRRQNIAYTGVAAWTDDLDLIKDAYGPAAFIQGRGRKYGKRQQPEVVLRLPNSYRTTACIQARNIGRKKKLNQGLDTLVEIRERAEQKVVDSVASVGVGGATSNPKAKRERMFFADLQQARDMDSALSVVSARVRGQITAEQERSDQGVFMPESRRRALELSLGQLQRTLYGFNRVEDGVGRFVILGCMPTSAGREQGAQRGGVVAEDVGELQAVRKEYERLRRSRNMRGLALEVRNMKIKEQLVK